MKLLIAWADIHVVFVHRNGIPPCERVPLEPDWGWLRGRNLRTWSQLNYTREDWILCRSAGLPENRNGDPE